jgi:DDE superfamily endonuclease
METIIALAENGITKFIQRNPRIASIIGRKIEATRIENTSQEALQQFFTKFEEVQQRFNVLLKNTWNIDEVGVATGVCTNTQVLANSAMKCTYTKSPEDREWLLILEEISTASRKVQPLVIFKGKQLQTTWFQHDKVPDWHYTTSENGWTSNNIAGQWLNTIFLPETNPKRNEARILLLDGHGSHISIDFLWECKQNNVHLVFLPPHSSHVLQPLDLSCFSPTKTRYRSQITELASLDDSAPVKKTTSLSAITKLGRNSLQNKRFGLVGKLVGYHHGIHKRYMSLLKSKIS